MPAGKPLLFPSVEILQKKIDAYFEEVAGKAYKDNNGIVHQEPLTITGLALALGTTRKTLIDYENKGEYSDTVKLAKTRVEHYAEKRLFGTSPTGAIFALKNYDWKDKSESEVYGKDGDPFTVFLDECRNRTAGLPKDDT